MMVDHTLDPHDREFRAFWQERHLCTVTFLKPDGRPHVIPMGVVLSDEPDTAWAITSRDSFKARLLREPAPIAVCQVDGPRWSTLEGIASLRLDDLSVAEAVRHYASRYRQPRPNPNRVAIQLSIDKVIGSIPSQREEHQ
jgi:PPOX class probable F420-dependent enzyme